MKEEVKKATNFSPKKLWAMFMALIIFSTCWGYFPVNVYAALNTGVPTPIPTSTTTAQDLKANKQIASKDSNGNYIFYANLLPGGATPAGIGYDYQINGDVASGYYWTQTGNTSPVGYKYFYGISSAPYFQILKSTSPNMDASTIAAESLNGNVNLDLNKVMNNVSPTINDDATAANYAYTDSDIKVSSDFRFVRGTSGLKDVMRYEYTVTNVKDVDASGNNDLYIAGKMAGDTMITVGPSSVKVGIDGDNALLLLDDPTPYLTTTTSHGFIPENGDIPPNMK